MGNGKNGFLSSLIRTAAVLFCLSMCLGFGEVDTPDELPTGAVSGALRVEGLDSYLGHVALWRIDLGSPDPRNFIVVPTLVEDIDPAGHFELKVPPGQYYLGAVLRKKIGSLIGPPQPGDLVFMIPEHQGQALQVEVKVGEIMDVGIQTSAWAYQGFTGLREVRITGQVVDEQGQPLAGLTVLAAASAERGQAPSGVSGKTTADGRFLLPFAEPGQVFLNRVRKNIDDYASVQERYMVIYPNDTPEVVEVLAGTPREVKIVVRRLPPSESGQGNGESPTLPRR